MQSALSFAPLRPVGFVNFHGAGRGKACFLQGGAGWGGATIPASCACLLQYVHTSCSK